MSNQEEPLDILHPFSCLEWDELPPLPNKMRNAQVVSLKGIVYVGGGLVEGGTDASYRLFSLRLHPRMGRTWTVTETPTSQYALVVHNSELLLVGGREKEDSLLQRSNVIYTLRNGKFLETRGLPPMEEERLASSAISTGSSLSVAGGRDTSGSDLSSVEVFEDGCWTAAPLLPDKKADMKSAFNGKQWALRTISEVYRVSLLSGKVQSSWEKLPKPPNIFSAIAYFGSHLLSIGGLTSSVFAFSPHSKSWVMVLGLPDDLVVNGSCIGLPSEELIVIGSTKGEYGHGGGRRVLRALIKVPLVNPDVRFSVSTLLRMDSYGINLIEELSKDIDHFHTASNVQLPASKENIVLSRAAEDRARKIFEYWERSNEPTYPATWEGLFTVLRKMNLDHLMEKIAKCVTGSVPEESLPLTTKLHTEKEVQHLIETLQTDLEVVRADNYELNIEKNRQEEEFTKEVQLLKDEISQLREEITRLKSSQNLEIPAQVDKPQEPQRTTLQVQQIHGSLPQDQPFELPGVEVVGRTSLTVTNSVQSFHWAGYGFKLHIPQDSLPADVDQCRLDIIASVAGQYKLPDNYQFFSAVCWVHPNPVCQFQKKLTVEMQHCAKSTKLCFVRADCSQGVPYTFEKLDCGFFSEQSLYGALEVDHFSGFGAAGEKSVPQFYTASTYYLTQSPSATVIHLAVTRNVDANKTVVEQYYREKCAREGACISAFELVGESEEISLDVPLPPGLTIEDCWRLYSMVTPVLTKDEIDVFIKGQSAIPAIQLRASLLNEDVLANLLYTLKLTGAKKPKDQLVLEITSCNLIEERVHTGSSSAVVLYPKRVVSRPSPAVHHSTLAFEVTHPPPPHWAMQLQHRSLTGRSDIGVTGHGDFFHSMTGTASGSTRAIDYPTVTLDQLVDRVGIDKEMLNNECTIKSLQRIAPLLPNWASYAKTLGFTEPQIQDVLLSHHLSTEMKALKVLEIWHGQYDFKATYRWLIDVCFSLGDVSVARELCEAVKEDHPSEDLSRPAPTGEKRRQEEVTEHTEEEQVPSQRPEADASEDTSIQ